MTSTADAKPPSTRSSQAPSIKSVDIPPKSPNLNGSTESHSKPVEKASVKDRLTRMFSTRDAASRTASTDGKPTPSTGTPSNTSPPPSRPSAPERKGSIASDKSPAPTTATTNKSKMTNGKDGHLQRFMLLPDPPGGHEHHLKSSRRQERLTDMIKGLLGRKSEPQYAAPENDLSLVNNWVDNLKREKEGSSSASDKKAANGAGGLVEKYGKCQEVVGRGAFGIVRISHKKMENGVGEKLFAVKEFRRRPEETEKKYSKRLTAEFCISSSLRHPNVIHTLDLVKDSKGDYCEVMEFCAGGDLYTLVLAAGKLEVQEADCFFKQMMRGVEYMHEMGVAHRDLKPENLLLTTNGGLKITDFGNGECFRMAWENDAHMVSGLCGSAPYIAPEEYIDREFDARAVDVWACGVIYMAMRTGRHLWRLAKKDEDEFYDRYLEGRRDEAGYGPIESLHRARCRNVIYSILDPNPSRRITASQVLKSEWGREIKLCKAGEEGL
ncbi:putative serine/threonine-protein kinase hal4 [Cercophora samala]|uniref:non-specific serine/threonine protein kinase n=1 Tax=Cercophora samala TaxID=330535 RepID=A0AA39ZMN1_9PEZI|nr:putative serine/threonine-protein kinase hal4 [Cercophora samala]